jgi:cell division GTPase FtsZ
MKIATIGVGNAGSKVSDSFLEMCKETGRDIISDTFVFNTAESDLRVLEHVPKSKQILLTSHDTQATGTGNKPELGAELMENNLNVVKNALSSIPISKTDALVVLASLGGGTGSGGAPIVSNKLREWFDIPVFGFAILPNERGHYEFNAARSFMDFGRTTDNLFIVDNAEYLSADESIRDNYQRINRDIAKKWVTLLSAGEQSKENAEMYVDAADLFAVLEMGGVSVQGYATQPAEPANSGGLINKFRTNGQDTNRGILSQKLVDTVKSATKNLTTEAELETAEGAVLLVSGPPEELTQRGIDEARQYLQNLTGAQRIAHGDDPQTGMTEMAAAVLFTNVGNVRRIDELKQRGKTAKQEMEQRREERASKHRDMFSDPDDELDSLL